MDVAYKLKMTYGEIRERMNREELILWALFFQYRNKMRAEAQQRARQS